MIKPLKWHYSRDIFHFPIYFRTHTNIFEYDSTNPEIANSHVRLIHTGNWSPPSQTGRPLREKKKIPHCGLRSSRMWMCTDTRKYDINKTQGTNKIAHTHTHTPRSWLPVKSYLLHKSLPLSSLSFSVRLASFCVRPDREKVEHGLTSRYVNEADLTFKNLRKNSFKKHWQFEHGTISWPFIGTTINWLTENNNSPFDTVQAKWVLLEARLILNN